MGASSVLDGCPVQEDSGGACLLIIDPQADFHEGGSLAVAGATGDSERIAALLLRHACAAKMSSTSEWAAWICLPPPHRREAARMPSRSALRWFHRLQQWLGRHCLLLRQVEGPARRHGTRDGDRSVVAQQAVVPQVELLQRGAGRTGPACLPSVRASVRNGKKEPERVPESLNFH